MTLKTTLNENTKAIEEHKSLEVPRSQKKKECSIVRLCKVNILGHWLFRFFFSPGLPGKEVSLLYKVNILGH